MRNYCLKFFLITYSILILLFSSVLKVSADGDSERQYRILFISSYGFSNPEVPSQLQGFEDGLGQANVDISYEFMDADKYYGGLDLMNFDKYIRYKVYSIRSFDLLVVADDSALRYAINNRNELFPDTPMVFMGINNRTEAITASAMKNATGIAENLDFEGNYELMKELFPDRTHLYVIVDSTIAGLADYVEFMKFRDSHPEMKSTVINASSYTRNGLRELLGTFESDDIILFLDFSLDGEKNAYSLQNAAEFISEHAPDIPIIRLTSTDIGHGVLGGISYSYYDAGKMAGEISAKILSGESADSIPLVTSAVTATYFEQHSMDKFDLKNSQLPKGATIINEHQTFAKFYRENKLISNLMIVILLLLIVIIVLLNIANNKRKKLIRMDFMTQMPNRKKIMEDIVQAVTASTPYGIIMLDVDRFKSINDTYGHKVGDEVIVAVAEKLKKLSKKKLSFARLGGDEFSGIFMEPSEDKARKICESIIKSVKDPIKTSAGDLKITVSIGCAMYPLDTKNSKNVMECADKALYETKKNGRNGYTLFDSINKSG
jgi:diguanylate cyclase (GGDEF)-like protein